MQNRQVITRWKAKATHWCKIITSVKANSMGSVMAFIRDISFRDGIVYYLIIRCEINWWCLFPISYKIQGCWHTGLINYACYTTYRCTNDFPKSVIIFSIPYCVPKTNLSSNLSLSLSVHTHTHKRSCLRTTLQNFTSSSTKNNHNLVYAYHSSFNKLIKTYTSEVLTTKLQRGYNRSGISNFSCK